MSQETDTFGIIMSSVEHTNASHFNCCPSPRLQNEANGTNMRCTNGVKRQYRFRQYAPATITQHRHH